MVLLETRPGPAGRQGHDPGPGHDPDVSPLPGSEARQPQADQRGEGDHPAHQPHQPGPPGEVREQRRHRAHQVKVTHRSLQNVVIDRSSPKGFYNFKIVKVELGRQLGEAEGGGHPDWQLVVFRQGAV